MTSDVLLVERRGSVDWLIMNRPDRLNAFNWELRDALLDQLKRSQGNDSLALVLTGTGRGFCAGADVQDVLEGDAGLSLDARRAQLDRSHDIVRLLQSFSKPTISVVDGVAAGGGWSLALATDFIVATARARFVSVFASIGLVPDLGAMYLLPRRVGVARALEVFLLRRELSAVQAVDCGAVDFIVPRAAVDRTVTLITTGQEGGA